MVCLFLIQVGVIFGFPSVIDPRLKVERFAAGLHSPSSMQFVDSNDILVLEREGPVRLITNGSLEQNPILNVSTTAEGERGLLGIAVTNTSHIGNGNTVNEPVVFLFYTEKLSEGGDLRNRVYRYDWNGQNLENRSLMLDLSAFPGPNHNGGKLLIGPDGYLYVIIGNLGHREIFSHPPYRDDLYDTGVLLRINATNSAAAIRNPLSFDDKERYDTFVKGHPEGPPLDDRFTDGENPIDRWYAYGIRNSFGIDFDPLTGIIWETENGPSEYDELNIVRPGFDSGWRGGELNSENQTERLFVNGSEYEDPVFSWKKTIGITDIEFLHTSNLGKDYENNIIVGDYNNGNLYYFQVNEDRKGVNTVGSVADNQEKLSAVTFGEGFEHITDLETGADGHLYILAYGSNNGNGTIYRIGPS